MTEQKLVAYVRSEIKRQGIAKVPAIEVFNLLEPRLSQSSEFTDALVAFASDHNWGVYPIGEVPFGELAFYPMPPNQSGLA